MTEIEKLQIRKDDLRRQLFEQEKVLNEHFSYLQKNIGSLVLRAATNALQDNLPPGIRRLVAPFLAKKEEEPVAGGTCSAATNPLMKLVRSFGIVDKALPLIVDLAIPFLLKKGVSFLKKKFVGGGRA